VYGVFSSLSCSCGVSSSFFDLFFIVCNSCVSFCIRQIVYSDSDSDSDSDSSLFSQHFGPLGHFDCYIGKGVGDDESSWGVDGDRLLKFHKQPTTFGGRKWQDGDVIGLACDLRADSLALQQEGVKDSDTSCNTPGGGSIWVSLNGDFSPPYGLAFHLPQGLSGLFAAFSCKTGAVRCNLGEEPFKYAPPGEGFMPMCSFSKLP
jgi:hypothetical protein